MFSLEFSTFFRVVIVKKTNQNSFLNVKHFSEATEEPALPKPRNN